MMKNNFPFLHVAFLVVYLPLSSIIYRFLAMAIRGTINRSLRESLFAAYVKIPCKRTTEAFDECKAGRKERSERASTRGAKPSDNYLEEMVPNIATKSFVGV